MWILKSAKGEEYILLTNKEHIVSRKESGNLVLANDDSISRTHAKIKVSHNIKNLNDPTELPTVILVDCGSKYGTFLQDNVKLAANNEVALKDGSVIKFGVQWNVWTLVHVPLIVTASTLNSEERKLMSQTVAALGGHVVPRWQDCCTHVTMKQVTLTIKVVCALALGCPIVTPKFWDSYLSSVSSKSTPPDYLDFIPPLAEASLNNSNVQFTINKARKHLFEGKLFVFHSKQQFDAFSCMVISAGGQCVIADDSRLTLGEMIQPNVIVMSYPFDRNSQETQVTTSFKNIQSFLQLKGRRLIPESEIGLAILKCSLDAFCNPTFKSDTEQSIESTQSLFTSHISGKTLLHSNESSSSKTSSLQTSKNTQSLTFNAVKSSDKALLLQESNILSSSLCKDESTPDSLGFDNSCPIRLARRRTRAAVIVDETSSELTDTLSMEEDSNTLHNSDKLTTNTFPDVNRRKVEVSKADIPVPDTRKRSRSPEEMKLSPKRLATNPPFFETKKNDAPFFSKKDIPSKVVLNKAQHSKIINWEQSDKSEKYDFSFREDQPKKSAGNTSSTAKRLNLININRCDNIEDDDENMFNFVGEPRKTLANKSNSIKKREISSIADEEDEICPQRKKRFTEESMWQHSISTDRSTTLNDTISLEGFVSVMKIKAKEEFNSDLKKEDISDYVFKMRNTSIVKELSLVCIDEKKHTTLGEDNRSFVNNFKKFRKIAPVRSSVVPIIIGGRDLEAGAGNSENGFHVGTVKQELEEEEEDDENNFEFNLSSQNL